MALTTREIRVLNAFKNCIERGEYSEDYAILLIEDNQRYGWLSNDAKTEFYDWLDSQKPVEAEESSKGVEERAGQLDGPVV